MLRYLWLVSSLFIEILKTYKFPPLPILKLKNRGYMSYILNSPLASKSPDFVGSLKLASNVGNFKHSRVPIKEQKSRLLADEKGLCHMWQLVV